MRVTRGTESLRKSGAFRRAARKGRTAADGYFRAAALKNALGVNRLGVSVSKKVSKKAVCRNLIRRRVKAAYRELERRLVTGADIVVSAKEPAASARYSEIRASIAGLLKRAGVLR